MAEKTIDRGVPIRRLAAFILTIVAVIAIAASVTPATALADDSDLEVTASVNEEIAYPGGTVTVTYKLTNISDHAVTVTWFGDDAHGSSVHDRDEEIPAGGSFTGTFSYGVTEQDGLDGKAEFAMFFDYTFDDYANYSEASGYCSVPVVPRVEFVNYDGSPLQTGAFPYGQTPVYTGSTPTRPQDPMYTYEFAGWDPEIVAVEGGLDPDAFRLRSYRYTAKYSQVLRSYTVQFVNYDGAQLQSGPVAYGETPKYEGDEPTRSEDTQYVYRFAGWSPDIADVTGEAIYTATFDAIPKATLIFDLSGGTLDGQSGTITIEALAGDTINLPGAPSRTGYAFVCWVGSEYKAGAEYLVDGDHKFTAKWQKVIPETGDPGSAKLVMLCLVAVGSLAVLIACALRRKAIHE
ncbi:MAG: InlB B-repeat-containing protein [Eggerthellaceae bacterium]|nr:InlB B-repeat-containing protein [Eggerthellaceae bacterium]